MGFGFLKRLFFSFFIFIFVFNFLASQCLAKEETKKEEINLCFTIDNNYPDHLLVTLFSIFENNKSNSHLNVFVIENNLSRYNKFRIKKFVKENSHSVEFIRTDMSPLYEGKLSFPVVPHVSKIGFARLLIPSLLPENIRRVLYLDSDILVVSDIKELYDSDISGYLAGMIRDGVAPFELKYKCERYHNSGVILIDLDGWRREKIQEKMIGFLHDNIDKFFSRDIVYKFPDQDILNIVLSDDIKTLPLPWNTLCYNGTNLWNKRKLKYIYPIKLIHFIGAEKPWDYIKKTPMNSVYDSYWQNSPFKLTRQRYFLSRKIEIFNGFLDAKRIEFNYHLNKTFLQFLNN